MRVPTSRAVVLTEFGRPPALDEFDVTPPAPGGVTVACRYGGICGTDLHLLRGHLEATGSWTSSARGPSPGPISTSTSVCCRP